ncbi:MAG: hypothetical protein UX39_C0013G0008 [Candidatus Magasanikbacteria bacterium GW2011_GWA2_46_17]|uniref:Aspartate/glutamate/uridylate kinase domain-containing protein n=1 Tax=Candidatus Magasanikbacteria bacterium GW2011_GWA2_46_17 TaxID=1619042 RepID=A0A0G1NZY8_9BACT|nr:MAG: hypothetical protein UX39_C0013G0008 [Candidatus Magasanikbacteria bacterium GW2011_GWA2_46_17]
MLNSKIIYKIISLGGSIVIPPEGFNVEFLKQFRQLIVDRVKKGDRFIIVVGGGSTCRKYQQAINAVQPQSDIDLDWLGIYTTHLNAHFVRLMFGNLAHKEIVINPTKKVKTLKPIIVVGGWKPCCSTDRDAVLLAKTYGTKEMINASNIDYVYTADPKVDPNAKPMPSLTWKELRQIIGNTWKPGANLPFDPKAAGEAEKLGLAVKFVKGTDLAELKNAISQGKIRGTVVAI